MVSTSPFHEGQFVLKRLHYSLAITVILFENALKATISLVIAITAGAIYHSGKFVIVSGLVIQGFSGSVCLISNFHAGQVSTSNGTLTLTLTLYHIEYLQQGRFYCTVKQKNSLSTGRDGSQGFP